MIDRTKATVILDTNVISEIMKERPEPAVVGWYLRQGSTLICTTAVTLAETLFGLSLMPHGRRRSTLTDLSHTIFDEELQGKVLSFDEAAARRYAWLRSTSQQRGRQMQVMDAQIAAIALNVGASIATRNIADFEHCGVPLINPWLSPE